MKCFFHYDANIHKRWFTLLFKITVLPFSIAVIFLTGCIILKSEFLKENGLFRIFATADLSLITLFAIAFFVLRNVYRTLVQTHSKYTYLEIGLEDVVVSIYAGEFKFHGDSTVFRRMVVIPFKNLSEAELIRGNRLYFRDKELSIRDYTGDTERMGYFFKDGKLKFKEYFLEESGFKQVGEVVIPSLFSETDEIIENIKAAKLSFDTRPKPKPYTFTELPEVKLKKMRERAKRF